MRATGANGILASATVVCGVPCSQPLGRMCGSKSATGEGQNKQGDCRALCWWLSLCYRLSLQKGTKQPGPLPVWAGTMGTQTSGWAQAPEQKQSWAGVAGGGGSLLLTSVNIFIQNFLLVDSLCKYVLFIYILLVQNF